MTETVALQRLRTWMAEDPKLRTQAWLARQLAVKPPSVHSWLSAQTRPEPHLRTAIKELAGITEELWWTDAERSSLDEARKRFAEGDPEADRPSATGTEG